MGLLYTILFISLVILLTVNLIWIFVNLGFWITHGIQSLLDDKNFLENIYYSTYLKWILLFDFLWLVSAFSFAIKRKNFRTDVTLDYLYVDKIDNPTMSVVIPTYNEESAISTLVSGFLNQKNVHDVIVVDNNSTDNTVEIAKKLGAKVITKNKNMGFAHSCVIGLKESLSLDGDIVVLVEGDGSYIPEDINKMIPYVDNCDMVVGTRALQILSEQNTQLSMTHIWGNYILAKLIQLKFFSLLHMGSVSLTDVGCLYRIIRKDSLKKIIDTFTDSTTQKIKPNFEFTLFMTIESLRHNLRIIEVPVSFKKRVGISKIGSEKKLKAIKIGFIFLWYILRS